MTSCLKWYYVETLFPIVVTENGIEDACIKKVTFFHFHQKNRNQYYCFGYQSTDQLSHSDLVIQTTCYETNERRVGGAKNERPEKQTDKTDKTVKKYRGLEMTK